MKSLLGQLLGPSVPAMGRLHEPSAPTGPKTPAANLTALRLRARELLEQLQKQAAADAVDRLEALRQLAGKLPSLIEDVKAGGAANAEWQALQKLLGDVQGLLAKKKLNESRLATVWSKAVTLLEAVAQGTGRTESFWK